ncbi:hypothetical protein cypCar_00038106 [Cyprinus carpio]|nr:hypothetical protein cypCar_00038106 [Cyprinus carpio]
MFALLLICGILFARAQGWSEPRIRLNSGAPVGTDVILDSGSPLHLICEGDGPVTWLLRLARHKRFISKEVGNVRSFHVDKATADFTGTYKCVYMNKNDSNESSSVHVFVRDPRILFVSPSTSLRYVRKEGEDLTLPCLLTDPDATDFIFRMDNGSAVPYGMNVTFDPKKGALIRNVHPGFNADYVCSARIRGARKFSKIFSINVIQHEPYIRLSPKLSSKLTHRGLSIEVNEGEDVDLRVLIEAYPPLISHQWVTPTSHNASLPENRFYNYNDRYEALMFLKRLNFQETGHYTLYVNNSMKNASITFDIKMYTKPVAMVRWENVTTLSCRSYGYPAPSILWYQCTGIRTTCPENSTGLQPIQTQTLAFHKDPYGSVGVESVLTVGPSNQRMTVVCVAFNLVGQGTDTFAMDVSDQLFTSAMCGSIVAMVVLALLLIFMIYKYKQVLLWTVKRLRIRKSPYPNILVDSKFYKMIKCGYQMSRPDFASPEMYSIMKMCWNLDPAERPTFSKISQLIERMLGDTEDQQETQYQNVQSDVHDDQQLESCDPVKHEEESFETSCDQEEEDQPLMKPNNYQFC